MTRSIDRTLAYSLSVRSISIEKTKIPMTGTNILHVIDTLGVGGAEKILIGTINGMPQYNHHLIYLTGSDALAQELPFNCKVTKLNFKSKWDIPRCVIALRKFIRANNISIVHSHLVMATLISRLACPPDVKLFNSIHSLLGSRCFAPGKNLQRFIEKITYKRRHHIIAVSEEVRRDYHQAIGIKGNCTILSNFVDDCFFAADYKRMNYNGTFRLVTVGNLKPAKNYSYLIEAFKKLPQSIQLDIYGEGPLRKKLQHEIDTHGLNIKLCGDDRNIEKILSRYDMFVMSSVVEGCGIALLEAMASGMPAMVSDIPVLREVTGNRSLYHNLNDTNDFIQKIIAIANHEVNLDEYAKFNFERGRRIAGKDNYMYSLSRLYMAPEIFRVNRSQVVFPVKILMPEFPLQQA